VGDRTYPLGCAGFRLDKNDDRKSNRNMQHRVIVIVCRFSDLCGR
jgi:hypothetical protein